MVDTRNFDDFNDSMTWYVVGAVVLSVVVFLGACGLTLAMSCSSRCGYGGLGVHACGPFDGCVCRDRDGKFLMRPPDDYTPAPVLRAGENYGAKP